MGIKMVSNSKSQLPLSLFGARKQRLDNFIASSNEEAVAVIRALLDGKGPQFLFLWGAQGSGKTHLLHCIDEHEERVPAFTFDKSIYTVDDVDTLSTEEQQRLFDLFNQIRANPGTHLVVTSDKSPKDLEQLGIRKDLTSRLSWGIAIELKVLTDDQKEEIIKDRAESRGLQITPEVFNWMRIHLSSDMGTLCRFLEEMDRFALSENRALTVPFIKKCLSRQESEVEN